MDSTFGAYPPPSNGRRLFSALKELRRFSVGFHPAREIRLSEFIMLHSVLCCLARRDERNSSGQGGALPADRPDKGEVPGIMISELSAYTRQTPSGVSQTIRSLEEKGLVTREILPADRRVVYVRPTEAGRALAHRAEDEFFTLLDRLADEMGEEETNQLIALIGRLMSIVDRWKTTEGMAEPLGTPERGMADCPAARRSFGEGSHRSLHSHIERMDEDR